MKKYTSIILSLICTLTLSGCASKKEIISLPTTVQKEISSSDIYIEECAKELRADINKSNIGTYAGGGLLFGLVDVVQLSLTGETVQMTLW